jgi:hypothetical protein
VRLLQHFTHFTLQYHRSTKMSSDVEVRLDEVKLEENQLLNEREMNELGYHAERNR